MNNAKLQKKDNKIEKNEAIDTNVENKAECATEKRFVFWRLVQEYYLFFVVYSVLGWCYEVFLEVIVYQWGFSNRGFLWGPYCPVYGFGALIFIFCLRRLKEKKIQLKPLLGLNITPALVFLAIVAIATAVELTASYLLEWATGGWLWNYDDYSFNFQGRIALNPSLRFGVGGMLILYGIQPFLEKAVAKLSRRGLHGLFLIVAAIMGADFIVKVASLF